MNHYVPDQTQRTAVLLIPPDAGTAGFAGVSATAPDRVGLWGCQRLPAAIGWQWLVHVCGAALQDVSMLVRMPLFSYGFPPTLGRTSFSLLSKLQLDGKIFKGGKGFTE